MWLLPSHSLSLVLKMVSIKEASGPVWSDDIALKVFWHLPLYQNTFHVLILNPEPFSAQSSTGRATTDPIPIIAGSPQHPFKQVFFFPLFLLKPGFCQWCVSQSRQLDLTFSPAASVSPYTALTPPPPTPTTSRIPSLQRLKSVATPVMENCLSGHGRSSRLIESIVGFLLWNFKPGRTEWPMGLQALSRTAYNEIKYLYVCQTYASGLRWVSKMYLFTYPEYHLLALCRQNWGLIEAICHQRRQENLHDLHFMFKTPIKDPVPKGTRRMRL